MALELPTASPFSDISQYTPLLIAAIMAYLMPESGWLPEDYEQANSYLNDLIYWLELLPEVAMSAPSYATIWHDEVKAIAGNDITAERDTDQMQMYAMFAYQYDAADGDNFAHDLLLEPGLYQLDILGIKDADSGILDWYVDNEIVVSGNDWYLGTRQYNAHATYTFTIAGEGKHLLEGRVNGKNGESSGYFIRLTKYWLTKLE